MSIREDDFPQPNAEQHPFSPGDRKGWLTIGTKQPLLINSRPLGAFSPLGQPEPERQWTVVSALLVVAAGQGFATAGMEVLAGCIIANGYLGIPAASVQTSGDFVRAAGMFLFAPIGGWLTDRRFSNWTVQVAAMASWAVGCILLLASGLIASGGNDGAAAWVPPLNATDASSGVWGIPAAGTGPAALGWIGCILAALGSGVIAPLSTLLVADQIKRPEQRGLAIALYYCAFKIGYLACILTSHRAISGPDQEGGDGALDVPVAASLIAAVAVSSTVLAVLRNRLAQGRQTGGTQPQWRPWNNLQDTKEDASQPFAPPPALNRGLSDSTLDKDEEARGCQRCLRAVGGFLMASSSGPTGRHDAAETLALWGLVRIFLVAALWALLRWQAAAWQTQAEGLDHLICIPGNATGWNGTAPHTNSRLRGGLGAGGYAWGEINRSKGGGGHQDAPHGCLDIGNETVQCVGALLGLMVFSMLHMGGFGVIATCTDDTPVTSVSPLGRMAMGYHCLTMAFFASGIVQLNSDYGTHEAHSVGFSVLWQLPQYTMLALSELLVAIHALEYAYAASVPWMRGIMTSVWYSSQGAAAMLAIGMQSKFERPQLAMHMLVVMAVTVGLSITHRLLKPSWWSLELLC